MERPTPIFVGSMVGWGLLDMLPEKPGGRQVNHNEEERRKKRVWLLLLQSQRRQEWRHRLYRRLIPSPLPLTPFHPKYTSGLVDHLQWTVTERATQCTWHSCVREQSGLIMSKSKGVREGKLSLFVLYLSLLHVKLAQRQTVATKNLLRKRTKDNVSIKRLTDDQKYTYLII